MRLAKRGTPLMYNECTNAEGHHRISPKKNGKKQGGYWLGTLSDARFVTETILTKPSRGSTNFFFAKNCHNQISWKSVSTVWSLWLRQIQAVRQRDGHVKGKVRHGVDMGSSFTSQRTSNNDQAEKGAKSLDPWSESSHETKGQAVWCLRNSTNCRYLQNVRVIKYWFYNCSKITCDLRIRRGLFPEHYKCGMNTVPSSVCAVPHFTVCTWWVAKRLAFWRRNYFFFNFSTSCI